MTTFTSDTERISRVLAHSRPVIEEAVDDCINVLQRFISHYSNPEDARHTQDDVYQEDVRKLYEDLQVEKPLRAVVEDSRSTYRYISKLNKDIEATFPQNPDACRCQDSAQLDTSKLRQVVDAHLIREGSFEASQELESHFNIEMYSEETLTTYRNMLTEIQKVRSENLDEAIQWAEENADMLDEKGSSMKFKLYCLKAIRLIKEGDLVGATEFLRINIDDHACQQTDIVQKLSTICIFPDSYPELIAPAYENDLVQSILKEAYGILHQPAASPLNIIVDKGSEAIPSYIALSKVKPDAIWSTSMPLEQGKSVSDFHTILVCPISNEVANNDNPAMLQPCGHWAARNSLLKQIKSSRDGRVKCHTCPQTFNEADLMLLIV